MLGEQARRRLGGGHAQDGARCGRALLRSVKADAELGRRFAELAAIKNEAQEIALTGAEPIESGLGVLAHARAAGGRVLTGGCSPYPMVETRRNDYPDRSPSLCWTPGPGSP